MERDFEEVRLIDLVAGEVHGLRIGPPARLRVLEGRVWVTEERLLDDIVASGGDEIDVSRRGMTVLEGLSAARVAVVTAPGWSQRLLGMLRRSSRRAPGANVAGSLRRPGDDGLAPCG
jgi:hypothetical protein